MHSIDFNVLTLKRTHSTRYDDGNGCFWTCYLTLINNDVVVCVFKRISLTPSNDDWTSEFKICLTHMQLHIIRSRTRCCQNNTYFILLSSMRQSQKNVVWVECLVNIIISSILEFQWIFFLINLSIYLCVQRLYMDILLSISILCQ